LVVGSRFNEDLNEYVTTHFEVSNTPLKDWVKKGTVILDKLNGKYQNSKPTRKYGVGKADEKTITAEEGLKQGRITKEGKLTNLLELAQNYGINIEVLDKIAGGKAYGMYVKDGK
jgi:hypothetical protein